MRYSTVTPPLLAQVELVVKMGVAALIPLAEEMIGSQGVGYIHWDDHVLIVVGGELCP